MKGLDQDERRLHTRMAFLAGEIMHAPDRWYQICLDLWRYEDVRQVHQGLSEVLGEPKASVPKNYYLDHLSLFVARTLVNKKTGPEVIFAQALSEHWPEARKESSGQLEETLEEPDATSEAATVGQIVHYYARNNPHYGAVAALVIGRTVDGGTRLRIFWPFCGPTVMGNVSYSEKPKAGCWSWPPRS